MLRRVHCPVIVCALALGCLTQVALAQIPTACADVHSLENMVCCPATDDGVCGGDADRGACVSVNFTRHNNHTSDVRVNWPHYYTRVCKCNGNFAGYDCSRCKFGYYGPDCGTKQILPRKPIRDFTEEDWDDYKNILTLTRSYDSGYKVVLGEYLPGNATLAMSNVSLYDYLTWLHQYSAKDSGVGEVDILDYAHFGPAFVTWHRLYNMVLEHEIQAMLQAMGREDYHKFRLPYWDWRGEIQNSYGFTSDELFSFHRLGETRNISGHPVVFGDIIGDGWDTVCLSKFGEPCDPNVNTGPLQRCPFTESNLCRSSNPSWPTMQEVNELLEFDELETPPYNIISANCMRGQIDFFTSAASVEECRGKNFCLCFPGGGLCGDTPPNTPFWIADVGVHSRVHLLIGLGTLNSNLPIEKTGSFADVVGSPNDPVFVLHHLMVDCILQEWLKRHPKFEYPVDPQVPDGHRRDDYVRGYFPLYTNGEILTRAEEFGFYCNLPNLGMTQPIAPSPLETTFSITITGSSVDVCVETKTARAFKVVLRDAARGRHRQVVVGASGCAMFEKVPTGLHRVRAISRGSGGSTYKSEWFEFSMK